MDLKTNIAGVELAIVGETDEIAALFERLIGAAPVQTPAAAPAPTPAANGNGQARVRRSAPSGVEVSVAEAAALAGVSLSVVYHALQNGDLRARKVDRKWMIDRASAVEALTQ